MTTTSEHIDLIVSGQYLLPTHQQEDVIKNGALAISGDTITATGTRDEIRSRYPDCPELHEPYGLIMPGLVNSHTHAAMSCFRGLADDLPLMTWLNDHIFPIEAKLDPEMVFYSTLLSLAEMIKSGTTSFCDMYLFAKDVARATEVAGVRGWIGEVLYDFPSPNYGELQNGFTYLQEMLDHYRGHSLINITVDPHSVYTCSPKLLEDLGNIARKNGALYVIHLSENQAEVQTCMERYGCTPVAHLENMGLLDDHTLASHCVVLEDQDIELLAKRRVKIAHCIESNMKLASGIAPIRRLLQEKINISLGTDGSASNNDTDMFSEMSSVAKIHKVINMDPTVMAAETTLHAATMGGAKCLGASEQIGSIVPGKKADFILLDLNQPHLTPLYNIPSHLVYTASGSDVIHSFINGRQVLDNRQLTTIDQEELLFKMSTIAEKVLKMDRK